MNVLEVHSKSNTDDRLLDEKAIEEDIFLAEFRRPASQKEQEEETQHKIFMVLADDFRHWMISGLGRIIGGFLRLCQENCSIYATFKKYIPYIVVFNKRILA